MSRLRTRRPQGDAGFTLAEMTVVILLMSVIGTIVMSVLISSMRQAAFQEDRTRTLNEAKVAMERITREIRGANEIKVNEPDLLQFEVRFEDTRGEVVRTSTLEVVPVTGDTWLRQTDVDRVVSTGVVETPRVRKVLGGLEENRSRAVFCYGTEAGTPDYIGSSVPAPAPPAVDADSDQCPEELAPAEWARPIPQLTSTIEVKIRIKQTGTDKAARLNQLVSIRNKEDLS